MGTLIEKEGVHFKECNVVMLPTEDKSQILLHKENRNLYYANIPVIESMLLDNPQHLYITSDDEIEELPK